MNDAKEKRERRAEMMVEDDHGRMIVRMDYGMGMVGRIVGDDV